MPSPLRFVVLQPGARLHYAVPALLARAGMLERLYTDIHAPEAALFSWLLRTAGGLLPSPVARLLGRSLPPELHGRVTSVPGLLLTSWATVAMHLTDAATATSSVESALRARILREKFRGASALYTLSNSDLELVNAAKSRGMLVVHEHIINPHVGRIMREERLRFPGIEAQDTEETVESGIARDEAQWRLTDRILVASDFVAQEICEHGIPPERIAIVPYGIPSLWLAAPAVPVPGRVLFVGSVGLRKGAHYLAAASRLLWERGVQHECRIVGPCDPRLLQHPEFSGPTYVGQVPRARVQEEFRRADVFVLPTLAEGFPLAHLEALACGVPVVTTPNCGSGVRDGQEGYLVPIRDPVMLADRIQQIIQDRLLRDRLSVAAKQRAAEFTWERYLERLLEAFQAFHG